MKLELGHIEIFVKEPLMAKDFYINTLGFELVEIQHDIFVWLVNDGKQVLLRPGGNTSNVPNYQKANIAFVFYTQNLDESLNELRSKGVEIKGNDGEGCYTFTDNDGNWIQIVNPNHR